MLTNKNINLSATCKLSESSDTIMTLSGNTNPDGSYNVSRYVVKPELYKANKETMDADEEAFEEILLGINA